MTAFPGAVPSFAGFTSSNTLLQDNHTSQHNLEQAEIVAVATKLGTGASTPTSGKVLKSLGAGTSVWAQVDLTTDVDGVLPVANGGTGQSTIAATAAALAVELGKILFPVGCIYTETTGVNPATTFGFGTWAAFGAGRVLIGAGTSDAVYTAGATGGESTHTLTIPEMPAHTHTVSDNIRFLSPDVDTNAPTPTGTLDYSYETPTMTTDSTGGGGSHNNLQPYIVVFFWQRTA